jgi:hypothetical protein
MLTEGRGLAVLVALLNLDSVGALELARRGSRFRRPGAKVEPDSSIVASVGWLEPPAHPLEAAVFRAVSPGTNPRGRSLTTPRLGQHSATSASEWWPPSARSTPATARARRGVMVSRLPSAIAARERACSPASQEPRRRIGRDARRPFRREDAGEGGRRPGARPRPHPTSTVVGDDRSRPFWR